MLAECRALGEPLLCRVPADLALGSLLSARSGGTRQRMHLESKLTRPHTPLSHSPTRLSSPRAPPLLAPPPPSSTPPPPATALLHAAASRAASPRVPSPPRLAASPRPPLPPAVLLTASRRPRRVRLLRAARRPRGAASAPPRGPAPPRRPRPPGLPLLGARGRAIERRRLPPRSR